MVVSFAHQSGLATSKKADNLVDPPKGDEVQKINPRADLGTFTFLKNYARFVPEKRRRETPSEAIDRMMDMHDTKYARVEGIHRLTKDIRKALKDKKMLGSQRALQFGGGAMLRSEMRMFNCAYSFFDRPEFLSEAVWLLLCGCGTGFSVQKHHVAKLPRLQPPTEWMPEGFFPPHVVGDSIEGWADAFDVLLRSYIHGTVSVRFDYSKVRPEGAALSSSSAKAPGPKPLRDSLEAVRKLLDRVVADGGTIRPIDAYDIVMHAAMCVRAGGIRRSATIALFSPDDTEMATAKTGDWFSENPQRRLSNNSALLVRATASPHEFHQLMESTQSFGEPGFFFSNSTEHGTNPCFSPDMRIATDQGLVRLRDVLGESLNVVTDARVTKTSVGQGLDGVILRKALPVRWTQTNAEVFEVRTEHGHRIKATANHTFITTQGRKQLKDLTTDDVVLLPTGGAFGTDLDYNSGLVLGSLTGDGCLSTDRFAFLDLWEPDFALKDVLRAAYQAVVPPAQNGRAYSEDWFNQPSTMNGVAKVRIGGVRLRRWIDATAPELKNQVPEKIFTGTRDAVRGYLQGLYAADGSVQLTGQALSATASLRLSSIHEDLLLGVQTLLSSFGVVSRIYNRREAGNRSLPDGKGGCKDYPCATNYELIISRPNMITFEREIGLIGPKADRLREVLINRGMACQRPERFVSRVASVTSVGREDVMCLTEPETNSVVVQGVVVGQCAEIGLDPVDERTGQTGWAMCNLTSVNVGGCRDEADFLDTCFLASALGTLQAGYTSTGYLGATTKYILERDALLGVSLTGMADRPDLAFDAALLRAGVDVVKMANIVWAEKLGIREAARLTTVKPEGSGSLSLEAGNGIHPHHHDRYLRYVEGGKPGDPLVEHIRKFVPEAVVQSAYNPDEVKILFPIDLGSRPQWLKRDTSAISHLEKVKLVQENWVLPGTRRGELTHNVSNTIQVGPDEWSQVEDFIWSNRATFGGVALLGATGDLDYVQAPFIEVLTPAEIRAKYGNDPARRRKSWEARRTWLKLMAAWQHIDWTSLTESDDLSGGLEIVACAGGACSF